MNYYFTGTLIILLTLLAFCVGPAYPKNEYLNSHPNECRTGEIDLSVSGRQYDYDNYDSSWNESNSQDVRLTFRKYLGNLQCNERNNLALENEKLRQQLELMKMCNKVNRNPTLKYNENFDLLVSNSVSSLSTMYVVCLLMFVVGVSRKMSGFLIFKSSKIFDDIFLSLCCPV